jgi:hypothetical protein
VVTQFAAREAVSFRVDAPALGVVGENPTIRAVVRVDGRT